MLTLPNILTLSRIVTVPLLVACLWWPTWEAGYAFGVALYCLMGVTDYFDGYLARAQGTVSKLGVFLDPIADKIMVAAVILMLVGTRFEDRAIISGVPSHRGDGHPAARDRGIGASRISRRDSGFGARLETRQMEDDAATGFARRADPRGRAARADVDKDRRAGLALGGGGADAPHRLGLSAGRPEAHGLTVRLLYFAWVRETIGTGEETVDLPPEVATVDALIDWLSQRSDRYAAAFANRSRLRAAVDQAFVALDAPIAGAHEIAIFPPVTGG